MQKVLHRNQINQAEPGAPGYIDQEVYVAIGAGCAAHDRSKERKRCEPTLTQRLLQCPELSEALVLVRWLRYALPVGRGFSLDEKPKSLANQN